MYVCNVNIVELEVKYSDRWIGADIEKPDQISKSVSSDQGLHCLVIYRFLETSPVVEMDWV